MIINYQNQTWQYPPDAPQQPYNCPEYTTRGNYPLPPTPPPCGSSFVHTTTTPNPINNTVGTNHGSFTGKRHCHTYVQRGRWAAKATAFDTLASQPGVLFVTLTLQLDPDPTEARLSTVSTSTYDRFKCFTTSLGRAVGKPRYAMRICTRTLSQAWWVHAHLLILGLSTTAKDLARLQRFARRAGLCLHAETPQNANYVARYIMSTAQSKPHDRVAGRVYLSNVKPPADRACFQPPLRPSPTPVRSFASDLAQANLDERDPKFVKTILRAFPGSVQLEQVTDLSLQKSGVDAKLHYKNGDTKLIQLKMRTEYFQDELLEWLSSHLPLRPGWIQSPSSADFICFYHQKQGHLNVFPWPELQAAWFLNRAKWFQQYNPSKKTLTTGLSGSVYGSAALAVPVAEIRRSIAALPSPPP